MEQKLTAQEQFEAHMKLLGLCDSRSHDDDMKDIDEVYPRLYQSSYIVPTENLALMKELGITHILAILPTEPRFPEHFTYLWFSKIHDSNDQNLDQYLKEGVKFITDALKNPTNKVLCHCAAGISRSGAFNTAYMLTQEPSWSVDDCIAAAKKRRPIF